jgi:TPR repeat protein
MTVERNSMSTAPEGPRRAWFCAAALALGGCAASLPPEVPDEPLSVTTTFAQAGDLESIGALCYRFKTGHGAPQDDAEALRWCARAAARGAAPSQVLLAEMYGQGQGTAKDEAKALRWYEAAAAQGHPQALLMLFHTYAEGRGVPVDRDKALTFLRRAADAHYPPAVAELARQTTGR